MNPRRVLLLPALFCVTASTLHAADSKSPFTDDLDAARAKAREAHKDVLVDFTGSDWCGFCIALDKEIFHERSFKKEAEKSFELVQLDFPRDKSKQTPEVTERNKKWKSELKSMSFPDILLLDEKGTVYATTGYREGGAKAFLPHLESLRQRRIQRDAALEKAAAAAGIEKARHLYASLTALRSDEVCLTYYRPVMNEIIALDPKNEAGVKAQCESILKREQCEREINSLCQEKDGATVLAKLKEYANKSDIPVESRQYALYMAGAMACERLLRDYRQALELIDQAIAVAPESPLVEERLNEAKKRLKRR
jgi:thioredoxin-related protein